MLVLKWYNVLVSLNKYFLSAYIQRVWLSWFFAISNDFRNYLLLSESFEEMAKYSIFLIVPGPIFREIFFPKIPKKNSGIIGDFREKKILWNWPWIVLQNLQRSQRLPETVKDFASNLVSSSYENCSVFISVSHLWKLVDKKSTAKKNLFFFLFLFTYCIFIYLHIFRFEEKINKKKHFPLTIMSI